MPIAISNIAQTVFERDYVPLYEVSKYMREATTFPYKSHFSFQPYIDRMTEKLCTACEFTQSALYPVIKEYQTMVSTSKLTLTEMRQDPRFQAMVALILPSMMMNDSLNLISPPFVKESMIATDGFQSYYEGGRYLLKVDPKLILEANQKGTNQYLSFILNKCYGQNISDTSNNTLVFKDMETNIERYFQLNVNLDFVDVIVKGDLPSLEQADINKLLSNADNQEYLLTVFPADMFEFSGFMIGTLVDVTDVEVMSEIRQYLDSTTEASFNPEEFHRTMEGYIRSYLDKSDITIGEAVLDERNFLRSYKTSLTGLTGMEMSELDFAEVGEGGLYHTLAKERRTVFCEDISVLTEKYQLEFSILKQGYHSLILHPIVDHQGKIRNIVEVAAKQPLTFNGLTVKKLTNVLNLLNEGYLRFLDELEGKISRIIKDQFTSIHPSVEWKFEEAATAFFNQKLQGLESTMPPIVFENLFPLYGQSDIVGSSVLRSDAIQADLMQNLELLSDLMTNWLAKKEIHILESYKLKVEVLRKRIGDQFVSSDETGIVSLITDEIHPLLEQLHSRYPELSKKSYRAYIDHLDDQYKIVYRRRKSFENSVSKLNLAISSYIEKEDRKMQSVQPHFFEKYKTDGVEYNAYVGQAILEEGIFSSYDLKNFKIWQLTHMCEIVRLVDRLTPALAVPIETAQLIFVYNHPISIRFRMDEKKFDVDGAYNVRYEILKKRIDKAIVSDTGERLTVAGKIAIVYLDDSDRDEYLGYLQYLKEKKYISPEIEDLVLDQLPGAEGLRALRVTVN